MGGSAAAGGGRGGAAAGTRQLQGRCGRRGAAAGAAAAAAAAAAGAQATEPPSSASCWQQLQGGPQLQPGASHRSCQPGRRGAGAGGRRRAGAGEPSGGGPGVPVAASSAALQLAHRIVAVRWPAHPRCPRARRHHCRPAAAGALIGLRPNSAMLHVSGAATCISIIGRVVRHCRVRSRRCRRMNRVAAANASRTGLPARPPACARALPASGAAAVGRCREGMPAARARAVTAGRVAQPTERQKLATGTLDDGKEVEAPCRPST